MESLSEATSGAVGALLSTTLFYPLDTCKTKYQAEVCTNGRRKYKNISDVFLEAILNGKIFSLYQGLGTKNLQSVISQFVYFYGYSYFRRIYSEKRGSQSVGTKANLVLAAAAGACTAVITQPLDTASSRMQTSVFGKSKGLWQILSGGTFSDAFDGLGISLLLTSNPAIQYTVFDQLKQRHLKRVAAASSMDDSVSTLSASAAFLLGAVSKCVATLLTYPAIRCKVMIQACGVEEEGVEEGNRGSRKTISGVARAIRKQEGWMGFFKGLEAQMAKTVLSSALLLMIKEKAGAAIWVLFLAVRRYMLLLRSRV